MNGIADFVLNNSGQQGKKVWQNSTLPLAAVSSSVLKQKEMGLNAQRAAIKAHYFLTLLVTTVVLQLVAAEQPQVSHIQNVTRAEASTWFCILYSTPQEKCEVAQTAFTTRSLPRYLLVSLSNAKFKCKLDGAQSSTLANTEVCTKGYRQELREKNSTAQKFSYSNFCSAKRPTTLFSATNNKHQIKQTDTKFLT